MNKSILGNGENTVPIWTSAMSNMLKTYACTTLLSITIAHLTNLRIFPKRPIYTWLVVGFDRVLPSMLQLLEMGLTQEELGKPLFIIDLSNPQRMVTSYLETR